MLDRRAFLAGLFASIAVPRTAHAGVSDWFNGVRVGASMPDHDATFVRGNWDDASPLVLVDFWATWCAPCITAIPHLNALQARYVSEGLHVVGISDEAVDVVAPFVTRKDMRYAVAAGGTRPLRASLKIRALPYAMLVDRARRIVWRGQPDQLGDAMIREHIATAKTPA